MDREKKLEEWHQSVVGSKENYVMVLDTLDSWQKRLKHKSFTAATIGEMDSFCSDSDKIKYAIQAIKDQHNHLVTH